MARLLIFAVLLVAAGLARVPPAAADPLRVCTLRYNTTDEIEVFSAALPAPDFEFVDLMPDISFTGAAAPGGASPAGDASRATPQAWLLDQCRAGRRCDILVVTGEFAGGFFGTAGASPSVQEFEEVACKARCAGLFHGPQEVFLLACNTLATKDPDERTPERYRNILLEHDFDPAEAEAAVALRYGPIGPSYQQAFRRIFARVPRVYGFASAAPLAQYSVPMLRAYFRKQGDYRRFLEAAKGDGAPNRTLLTAFAETSLIQVAGLQPGDPAASDRDVVCALYDDSRSVAERLQLIQELSWRHDFLAFVPTMQIFLRRHPPAGYVGAERQVFARLQASSGAREQVVELLHALDVSTGQLELAQFAAQLGWISQAEFRQIAVTCVRTLLHGDLTAGMVDVMCAAAQYQPIGKAFLSEDLPDSAFADQDAIRLVACLSPPDRLVDARLAAALDCTNPWVQSWAAYALSQRLPLSPYVLQVLARHLDTSSVDVRERLRWILTAQPRLYPTPKR